MRKYQSDPWKDLAVLKNKWMHLSPSISIKTLLSLQLAFRDIVSDSIHTNLFLLYSLFLLSKDQHNQSYIAKTKSCLINLKTLFRGQTVCCKGFGKAQLEYHYTWLECLATGLRDDRRDNRIWTGMVYPDWYPCPCGPMCALCYLCPCFPKSILLSTI